MNSRIKQTRHWSI